MMGSQTIKHVTSKQWISTDRSTLETIMKPRDEFTNMLIAKLAVLQPQSLLQFSKQCV
jgi:hypothetical protein